MMTIDAAKYRHPGFKFYNTFFPFFQREQIDTMVNSQLIDLLQHFSADELQELQMFVASPYFNRGNFVEESLALVNFISAAAPGFAESDLKRSDAYRAVFPGSPMVEGKLDKVMSELHKLAKEFISVSRYMQPENEFRRQLDQAAFYRTHGLDQRYQNLIQKLEARQKDVTRLDQDYFDRALLLDYEIHSYENLHNQKRGDVHIQETLQSLDLQYFFIKTQLLNLYLLQQKVARLEIPMEMTHAIRESHLPERYAGTYPVLLISYKIFRLLESEQTDTSEFDELHQLLKKHELEIEPGLLKYYYTFIRNFCVLLVNHGRNEFQHILLKIQKENLQRGYLYYDNKISPSAILNVVNSALLLKDYAWVEEFIHSHKGRIVGDNENQDYFNLIQSNFLFHTGKYESAIGILPQSLQELDYHIFSRRLEMKIYYELNSDLLPYKVDAFKMYLSRASQKVISTLIKERNTNFINLLFQISTTARGDKARSLKLIQRIQEKQSIADREWLLEKAAQLAK